MRKRKRHTFFIKCVCVIVAFIFAHQQLGWAQGGKPVWAIEIPYDVAGTREAVPGTGDDVIIHIQDAHSSLSAQYSIAKLLDTLVTDYDLSFVALEGASGEIDTSLLRTFPDAEIRKDTAAFLMREGRMSAGEFFAVTSEKAITLCGIEDDALYQKNVESFRSVAAERAEQTANIDSLIKQFSALSGTIYSDDMKALNRNCAFHRDGVLSFSDHWKTISFLARKNNVDVSKYAELFKLLGSIRLEKDIKFKNANRERRQLIDELSAAMSKPELEELVLRSLAFKQNKLSQGNYHKYLLGLARERGISVRAHENLIKFTRYVTIYESIDLPGLYKEMNEVEDRIRETLYRNLEERELYHMTKMARLLGRLYSVALTNDEFACLEDNWDKLKAARWAANIRDYCKKYEVPIMGGYDLSGIMGGLPGAMGFYRDAEARNGAMLANTIRAMRKSGKRVAALITGGYHTDGLTDIMREKGLSYLVIAPKFESGKERPYVAILTNKKKAYEQLIETGKYQLAVSAYFATGDRTRLVNTFFYALGRVAAQNGDVKKAASEWYSDFSDYFNNLSDEKKARLKALGRTPEWFKSVINNLVVVRNRTGAILYYSRDKRELYFELTGTGEEGEYDLAPASPRAVERIKSIAGARAKQLLRGEPQVIVGEKASSDERVSVLEALAGKYIAHEVSSKTIAAKFKREVLENDAWVRLIAGQLARDTRKKELTAKRVANLIRAKGFTLPNNWATNRALIDPETGKTLNGYIIEFYEKIIGAEHRVPLQEKVLVAAPPELLAQLPVLKTEIKDKETMPSPKPEEPRQLGDTGSLILPLGGVLGAVVAGALVFGFAPVLITLFAASGVGILAVRVIGKGTNFFGSYRKHPFLRKVVYKKGYSILAFGLIFVSLALDSWWAPADHTEDQKRLIVSGHVKKTDSVSLLPVKLPVKSDKAERPSPQERNLDYYEDQLKAEFADYWDSLEKKSYFKAKDGRLILEGVYYSLPDGELRMPSSESYGRTFLDATMPQRRLDELDRRINKVWAGMDKRVLPEYIRSKVNKEGNPVEELQKPLFALRVFARDMYDYLERRNVRVILTDLGNPHGRCVGDRWCGVLASRGKGAIIELNSKLVRVERGEKLGTLNMASFIIHESAHHRDFPTNLASWDLFILSRIQEWFSHFAMWFPSFERNAFGEQLKFMDDILGIKIDIETSNTWLRYSNTSFVLAFLSTCFWLAHGFFAYFVDKRLEISRRIVHWYSYKGPKKYYSPFRSSRKRGVFPQWILNKKHYRISPTKRYFSRRYLHKISWGNSFLAGFGFFALGLTLSGLSADAAAALTFSAAVFAVQALDLKVGVIAWMNELFGKIIPTRAGPELIKPFKETRPAGKEELAYVQDGTLYVDAGEMATRPKLVQWLYYSHEWLHLKGMKSHVVLYAAQGTLIALAAALFTGVVLVPVTAMTFGAFMLFAFKEDIEAVDDPGVLVKSLNKKFPESEIDKKEFVDRFYDNLPRHIFADKKYAVSLLETTYEKALSVLKDPTKLSFEFQPTPGGKGDQLILAFADVRRGIDRFVADTIATEGVDLRDQNAFTVEVPYGDSVSRVVISMKDLSESGSERLEERTKSRIKAAFQGFSATPIMEYRGFSSIDDALASGDAAFIDAVGGVDIVAVVHNIIPREMQYDADQAAKFIEEKIEEFENRIKLFLVEAKEIRQVELTEDVEKEMEMLANETKKELRAETILGAKIVKSEPAMTMYFKILKRISELKKETKQKKNISALSALDVNLKVDVLRAFSEVIYSEDRFLRSISAEKVPGEKEKLVSILNKVRDENVKVLARTRDDLVEPVKMMVEEVRRRVLKQVEGEALPASIALCDVFCAFEETKKKGDGEQKIREIFDEAQNIVRRVIAELEETEIFIKEFKPAENDRPRVLFLKGSLLAADLENFVKNENVKLIVTTEAGPTTHWVLVAKDLNVPVFFAVKKAGGEISGISIEDMRKKIKVGDRVLFDGSTGSLISDPDVQMERDHEEKIRRHAAFETYYKRISQKPAVVGERTGTEGGRKMDVLVNAEQEDELVSALSEGADGTGLVRTEMWLSPDLQCLKDLRMSIAGGESGDKLMDARDELKRRLMEKIRGMIDRSNGKNITFRMFDAADDKQIGGQKQSAFGLDFYRTPLGHELLMIELEALFEVVAGDRHSNVKLLFPQVQNKKDVIEIREKWGQEAMDAVLAGLRYQAKKEEVEQTEKKWKAVPIGAMIESTEAVRNIKGILAGVDFVSIGTNDLIRDIFRRFEKEWGVENLRATIKGIFLFRQFQLPVARKMETIAKAVSDFQKETGRKIPVTICGNSASIKEYLLHMVYVSYKYDVDISPSIPFVDIAETKEFIRNFGHEGLKTVFETLGKGAQERVEEKVRGIKGRIANLPEVKKIMGEDAQKKAEKAREETVPLEIAVEKDEVELPKGPESQKDSAGTGEKMTLLIVNEKGLHLRSGAKIVRLMEECKADIAIWKAGGKDAPTVDKNAGKYIEIDGLLELLMFGEKKGTEIKLLIKGKNKEKFIKKLLELEDENSKGKPERVFVRVTSAEKDHHEIRGEFSVIIGVPDDVYIALGEGRIEEIEKASDIIITGVKTAGKAAMEKAVTMKGFKQKVDRMAKGRKAIAAFLDIDKEQIEEAEAIIKDFADKAAWDILKLTYPWMSSLSGETRRRLDELEKGELAGIHGVLLKTFEDMGFSDLGQKSMYEIRAENMYNRHREDYTVPLKEYLASGLNGKEARRYMVTAVDNAFDMTMLAGAIKERREMMGWTPDKEDPVMDFLIVRNEREAENIEEVLIATGLGRYLSVEQVIVVGKTDTLTPEEVMREIRKRTGKALRMKQVTMGQGADIIRIDMTNPGEIFRADNPDSPRLVQLEKGLASQLYRMMLEIQAAGDKWPSWGEESGLRQIEVGGTKYNLYVYLPEVDAIDIDLERKEYERYVLEVLVKA